MSLQVYPITYDVDEPDGHVIEQISYVTAPNLLIAARESQKHADQYEHDLKSVRYVCNIVRQYGEGVA